MEGYIKVISDQVMKKKQFRRKIIKAVLITMILSSMVIALTFNYWIALPSAFIVIGVVWYVLPITNIHIYPEDIQLKLQQRLHQLEDEEKKLGLNSQLLIEEQEIKNSLYILTHKEDVFEE